MFLLKRGGLDAVDWGGKLSRRKLPAGDSLIICLDSELRVLVSPGNEEEGLH